MTENECIENLNILVQLWEDDENMYSDTLGIEIDEEFMSCIYKSIEVLKEIQKYRAIGTVEECREARERQRGKRPILSAPCKSINYYLCPDCGEILRINRPFCSKCGSAIDWSDTP